MNFKRIKVYLLLFGLFGPLLGFGQQDSLKVDWTKIDLTKGSSKATMQNYKFQSDLGINIGARTQATDVLKIGFFSAERLQGDIYGDALVKEKFEALLGQGFGVLNPNVPVVNNPFFTLAMESGYSFGKFRHSFNYLYTSAKFEADQSFLYYVSLTMPSTMQGKLGGTLNYRRIEYKLDYALSIKDFYPFIGLGVGVNVSNVFGLYAEIKDQQIDLSSSRSRWGPVISTHVGLRKKLSDDWTAQLKANYSMQRALGDEFHSAVGVEIGALWRVSG